MKVKIFCLLFIILISSAVYSQEKHELLDSIILLRENSTKSSLSKEKRINFAKRAVELSLKTKIDSTLLKSERNLSFIYLMTGEYDLFRDSTLKNLSFAQKLNDSSAIARSSSNLGFYYYQIADNTSESYSYYLQALKYYDALNVLNEKAAVLTALATIQDDEKDYLGSEQNAIEALKIINSLEEYESQNLDKYYAYNLLGLVSLKLENYEQSIDYHNQAFDVTKTIDDGESKALQTLNNLAFAYREKGELDRSLEIFGELLQNKELKENDITFYALILNNYTFTKFLKGNYDYKSLEKDFHKALKIADSIDDSYTKLAASIDLAKFYKANNEFNSALNYAKQSYKISKDIPINELYLESMFLLSDLTKGEESKNYLKEHIKLSDSLLKVERAVRNKFARIEYETDQLEAENKQISRENLYLLILSAGLLLTAILVYLFISQRAKNRKLKLIQVQQKANEDIYNLMLSQQDKVDEARTLEKKRISEELHDGVLGRLFGTRLSLDSINFKDGKDAMMTRANYIGQLKIIEEDIRKISHELNTDFVSGSGFMDIVSELIENQTKAYGLTYEFNYTDDISWDSVSNKTKINIYRIIQESMQNIYKHANAKAIKISISLEKDVICLDIIDDGEGFDTSKSKKGIGLKNMMSRVEDINGKITFTSQSGNGTTVNVKIPYE
ncbi:tetratricopeptide repeat-containing sensor histidine kinase [Winogradskyella sp. MH6]|uniref:tetratricopeptide repeat-containing sensor histidine kinase n=1 Tax=Winogradskyella sp. MH6 TaxID=2929510 RepID=UPI001FB549CC|nr:tetratricopeptide repeat protein [Winogradskyella sp. MH6]